MLMNDIFILLSGLSLLMAFVKGKEEIYFQLFSILSLFFFGVSLLV
jgi:hypothetical protein